MSAESRPARIKLYTDEHIAGAIAKGLRLRGIDVLTVAEAGLLGASDEEQLARARAEGRVLFTHDADFLRLHAAGVEHAGIVYAPRQISVSSAVHGLRLICEILSAEEMNGHVEFLT